MPAAKKIAKTAAPKASAKAVKKPAATVEMAKEMVDVVDEKDVVLRTVARTVAEDKGLRVRGVQVLLENAAGEILVQWRIASKRTYPRTFISSAAGLVSAGDDYATSALRELVEEMGVVTKLKRVGKFHVDGAHPLNGELFVGTWDGDVEGWEDEADVLDMWSVDEAEFMLGRFPYLLAPTFVESLKLYLKWRKKNEFRV
jgi:16S rRNA (adenine1518-N6/adenine1519-N6)-dimethyltransferase